MIRVRRCADQPVAAAVARQAEAGHAFATFPALAMPQPSAAAVLCTVRPTLAEC